MPGGGTWLPDRSTTTGEHAGIGWRIKVERTSVVATLVQSLREGPAQQWRCFA